MTENGSRCLRVFLQIICLIFLKMIQTNYFLLGGIQQAHNVILSDLYL